MVGRPVSFFWWPIFAAMLFWRSICACVSPSLSHLSFRLCFRIAHTLQEEPSLLEYMINDTWSESSKSQVGRSVSKPPIHRDTYQHIYSPKDVVTVYIYSLVQGIIFQDIREITVGEMMICVQRHVCRTLSINGCFSSWLFQCWYCLVHTLWN